MRASAHDDDCPNNGQSENDFNLQTELEKQYEYEP